MILKNKSWRSESEHRQISSFTLMDSFLKQYQRPKFRIVVETRGVLLMTVILAVIWSEPGPIGTTTWNFENFQFISVITGAEQLMQNIDILIAWS